MRGNSSPSAETHKDYESEATFIDRFANFIDCARSDGRSAPTDPERFFTVRYDVAASQQRWTRARFTSWQEVNHFAQRYEAISVEHYTRRCSVLTSDSDCTFAIACCLESEASRSLLGRGPLALDLLPPLVS